MKVFVLSGCDAYEMREVLGVYKSIEDAKFHAAVVAGKSFGNFGYFELSVNNLDGEAQLMNVIETWDEEDLVDVWR